MTIRMNLDSNLKEDEEWQVFLTYGIQSLTSRHDSGCLWMECDECCVHLVLQLIYRMFSNQRFHPLLIISITTSFLFW